MQCNAQGNAQGKTPIQRRQVATRIMKCLRGVVSECVRDTTLKVVFSIANTHLHEEIQYDDIMCCIARAEVFPLIRDILTATLHYLTNQLRLCVIPDGSEKDRFASAIKHLIEKNHDESPDKRLLNWISQAPFDVEKQDAFTYFQVNGIVVLCGKPNLCGYYSRGNALDILKLFEIIRPVMKQLNLESSYRVIYEHREGPRVSLNRIFRTCVDNHNSRIVAQ